MTSKVNIGPFGEVSRRFLGVGRYSELRTPSVKKNQALKCLIGKPGFLHTLRSRTLLLRHGISLYAGEVMLLYVDVSCPQTQGEQGAVEGRI